MYGHNVLKAILIPLATLLGIIGAIMILYGGITMFKQDGNKVRAQGLVNELALYTDCSYRADLISNMTAGGGAGRDIALVPGEGGPGAGPGGSETGGATGGSSPPGGGVTGGAETSGNVTETKRPGGLTMEFRNAVMDYCDAQNRPYMYLFVLTGSMVFLSTLLSLCMAWRSPKSVLNWWNVHNAVTLALLFMSIYGMMQASRALYRVHNCEGYDAHTMRQMKRAGMACYGTTGGDSVAAYLYNHVLPIFWVGVALSLASIFLNTLLTSGLWHFKDYYYGEEERRPAAYGEPVYHQRGASFEREPAPVRRPSSSTVPGPTVVSTTGATREPYFYSEEERRRAQPPAV